MALTIGAVVPNYEYARYLPERLASIRAQERPVDALVFLDDASRDESWAVAERLLPEFSCHVVKHRNRVNSGSVLKQWQAGIERLQTDLVWIAEADDRAAPGLLAALAPRLEADPQALFAFCDSAAIGSDGARTDENSQSYYVALGDTALTRDGVFPAEEFLARCLSPRNLVVSASAVLWRAGPLAAALAAVAEEGGGWLCAGDWRVYAEACAAGGTVHYLATPLSEHRRHPRSVTGGTPASRHFAEVIAMQVLLRQRLGPDAERDAAMRRHLGNLRRAWNLATTGPARG
jgi:glycosyltransferase involved in cell wall biosynthesis